MKIIIAPAKVMKYKQFELKKTDIIFPEKTNHLHEYLKQFSIEQLHDQMKISFKIAQTVYDYFHGDYPSTPALYCYQGTVFKQLNLKTYNDDDFKYLNDHLNILSAYYGILKYNTAIKPYRLDMIMKFDLDLYAYWQEEVNNYFKDEDYIISLASKEFSKMVKHENLINIDFVQNKAGKLTRNSMHVKQARGKLLDIMIKQKISSLDTLKEITFDEYHFDKELSTNNNFVFIKDAELKLKKL